MRQTLLLWFMVCAGMAFSQTSGNSILRFTYDATGNLLRRQITLSPVANRMALSDEKIDIAIDSVHKNIASDYKVKMYPNPSSENINISMLPLPDIIPRFAVVRTLQGNELLKIHIESESTAIPIKLLPNGVYVVSLIIGESVHIYKVIKQ